MFFLLLRKMADMHTKAQRSFNMSRIKGKNAKPEILVRKFLHAQGYRLGMKFVIMHS